MHPDFHYPDHPGWMRDGTSRAAADDMAAKAPTLRNKVLALLFGAPLTADECASRMNESVLAVRPRLTELERLGHICDSGKRRVNSVSGKRAIVWEIRKDGGDG